MFESLLRDWSFIRVVRLVLGIMLIGQSFQMQSWAIGLFGGLFVFKALPIRVVVAVQGVVLPPFKC